LLDKQPVSATRASVLSGAWVGFRLFVSASKCSIDYRNRVEINSSNIRESVLQKMKYSLGGGSAQGCYDAGVPLRAAILANCFINFSFEMNQSNECMAGKKIK